MKTAAWGIALLGLAAATVVPRSLAVAIAILAAFAWGYLFTVDYMEHR